MVRAKDSRQEEMPGMETPKDRKIENAARKFLVAKQEKDNASKALKSAQGKVRELMHAAEKLGAVRRVSEKGTDFLVYAREDINVRVEIKETLKVKLGEDAAEELPEPEAAPEGDGVEVTE